MDKYSLENYIDIICAEESFKDSMVRAAKIVGENIKKAIDWLIEKWKAFLKLVKNAFSKLFNKRIPDTPVECEKDAIDALVEAGVMIKADNVDSLNIPNEQSTQVPNFDTNNPTIGDTNGKPSMEAIGYTDLQAYNTIVSLRNVGYTLDSVQNENDIINPETALVKPSFLLKLVKGMIIPIDKRNKVISNVKANAHMIDTPLLQRIRNSFLVFIEAGALVLRIVKIIITKALKTPVVRVNTDISKLKNRNNKTGQKGRYM